MARGENKKYDVVFIGTGIISVLEAVYQSLCGKSVLIVDQQREFGGSWLCLNIFGLHDVENAIHYFLPDVHAPAFLNDVLKWDVVRSERKYRIFSIPPLGCWAIPYDNSVGRFVSKVIEALSQKNERSIFAKVIDSAKEAWFQERLSSCYVRGGAPEMLRKVKAILAASDVEVKYSTMIERIHFDTASETVECHTRNNVIASRAIVLTHGSKLEKVTGPSGPVLINKTRHPRPAAHLFVQDETPSSISECVFTADPLIKYAHDVTRFVHESSAIVGKRKVIVLALRNEIQESADVYRMIFEKLRRAGVVGKDAVLLDQHWWDIVLPEIDDAVLEGLQSRFSRQVQILKTENFTAGVGYYAQRWVSKIKYPLRTNTAADKMRPLTSSSEAYDGKRAQ